MSKEAALRAMREARYNAMSNRAAPAAKPKAPGPPTDALCGHRSVNGRTCTREQGHTAKNHRYS